MEKKSERLEVRLGYEEKQDFTEACENQGDTPSGAIRRFISGYVRRSDADVLSSAWRGAAKRRLPKLALVAGIISICAISILSAYKAPIDLTKSTAFAFSDRNNDGELRADELGPVGDVFLKVMDVDDSGAITLDEFISKGRMVYVLAGPKNDPVRKLIRRDGGAVRLIKFNMEIGNVRTEIFELLDSQIEMDESKIGLDDEYEVENLDRIVFWHEGGGVTVLDGPAKMGMNYGRTRDYSRQQEN